jgi:hypothetical protein
MVEMVMRMDCQVQKETKGDKGDKGDQGIKESRRLDGRDW